MSRAPPVGALRMLLLWFPEISLSLTLSLSLKLPDPSIDPTDLTSFYFPQTGSNPWRNKGANGQNALSAPPQTWRFSEASQLYSQVWHVHTSQRDN